MECPNCKLNLPPGTVQCECGYDLRAGLMPGISPPPHPSGFSEARPLKVLLGLALIAVQLIGSGYGFTSESGAEALWYNVFAGAFYAAGAYLIFRGLGSPPPLATALFSCLSLALALVLQRSQDLDWISSLEFVAGAAIAACVIVGIYYKVVRVSKLQWTKGQILTTTCFWTLIFALPLYREHPGLSNEDISQLMAEVTGQAPISRPDNDAARIVRAFLRDAYALRQEVAEAGPSFQTPEMSHLLQPVSYSSRESIIETLKQLAAAEELSQRLTQGPKNAIQRLHAARLKLPNSPYATFLKHFEVGATESLERNEPVHEKERAYLDSEIGLYQFALHNFSKFVVINDQLVVVDDQVLSQYNGKLAIVRQLEGDYKAARKQFETEKGAAQTSLGFSFSDPNLGGNK
jgi:tetratricopeptide (TPR) repeat protein